MAEFSMSFDPHSLSELARFAGFAVYLSPEMAIAMDESTKLISQAAIANTWSVFTNPSGKLASTIHPLLTSPYEAQVVVEAAHRRRREKGFSGLTDRLGRYYPYDPAKPYLEPAMIDNEQAVLQLFDAAIAHATARLATG